MYYMAMAFMGFEYDWHSHLSTILPNSNILVTQMFGNECCSISCYIVGHFVILVVQCQPHHIMALQAHSDI